MTATQIPQDRRTAEADRSLVYSCSGCSSAAQICRQKLYAQVTKVEPVALAT